MKIKGKPYRKAYALGRDMVKDYKDYKGGICCYGAVGSDGEDRDDGAPCHAGLDSLDVGLKQLVVDMPYDFKGAVTNRIAKKWLRYILEKSPFAETFAEDKIDAGWRRGYYVYTADVDANLLCAALVAVRSLSEYPKVPVMFDKLTKAGADPDMAFFASYMTGVDGQNKFFININTEEGHVAMVPSWFNNQNLINFITSNYEEYGHYSDMDTYRAFNSMWGNEVEEDSWGGRVGVYQKDGVPIRLNKQWIKVLDKEGGMDNRKALFNHEHNRNLEKKRKTLHEDKAIPLFAKILNDYRGGLNVA